MGFDLLPGTTAPASWALIPLSLILAYFFSKCHPRWASSKPKPDIDYFQLSNCPLPRPLLEFDLAKARPRPYRPLRWKYHQTMALSPLEPDWWIELESTYKDRIKERQILHAKHGRTILDSLPGSEKACKELMFMVMQFLCARYPTLFSFDKETHVFSNNILGTYEDTDVVHPLRFLLDNVPEDFLVTQEDPLTGLYLLKAGVSCSAIGWNMETKMGKPLHEIHKPVPDYDTRLRASVDRFFSNLPTDKPIQRSSWSFEVGKPLFLQTDDPDYLKHRRHNPNLKIEDIHLRVDWQTLRRLPRSKAIIFNFKALFTPVTQFKEEAYIPQLIAKVLSESKPSFREYKGWASVEHKLLPALQTWAKGQVQQGMVPECWEERTLDEHPFFPGWNNKSN